jgi:hypothetical protein
VRLSIAEISTAKVLPDKRLANKTRKKVRVMAIIGRVIMKV